MSRLFRPILLAVAALPGILGMPLRASTIIWTAAQNVSDESNVRTDGSLVVSALITSPGAPANATVNGVAFADFLLSGNSVTDTIGNVTIARGTPSSTTWGRLGISSTPPFASLSSAYQTFLSQGMVTNGAEITLSIAGLTPGSPYLFQWWSSMASTTMNNGPHLAVTSVNGGPPVDANRTNSEGGLGQFQVGTFIADSPTQSFVFAPAGFFTVEAFNGFQLRKTPEPGPVALLLAGLGLLAGGRRRGLR